MDPISNADRLVALLREKLLERGQSAQLAKQQRATSPKLVPAQASGIRAYAAIKDADEQKLRRAFLQNLLADQLGTALMNDSRFQQIVSRVHEAIDDDPSARELLAMVVADLRAS